MSKQNRPLHFVKLTLVLSFLSSALLFQFVEVAGWASSSSNSVVTSLPAAQSSASSAEQGEFFEKKVRPILAENCQSCHNTEAKTAGLDLSTAEGFMRGGDSGSLVNKEQPESSLLLKVVSYEHGLKMPPSGKLKDEQIATLTAWVKMGAVWPGSEKTAAPSAANPSKNSSGREFTESEKKFWAFQPIKDSTPPPQVKNTNWVRSPIDRFILRKLEEKNLTPAPPADKLALLRRATFDLTGLPPTEAEIKEFSSDNSPDAFKKVVERLLASPRYGEQWGRHWLDVARYADSTGSDEDHRYPHAWKYRDYVIDAFNRDVPYDRFVREQIAGDLLPSHEQPGEVNKRGIIATGFLALGPKAIAQQDKQKMLYDVYDEQVDVTSKAFMGLTISCARCHNHKFDPILTKDYYSMVAVFASTRSFTKPDSHVSVVLEKPLISNEEFARYKAAKSEHQAKEKQIKLAVEEIVDSVKERAVEQHNSRIADYMIAARKVYQDNASAADLARQTNLSKEAVEKWVAYLKPGDKVRQHLLDWDNAAPEKLTVVATAYQQRFEKRLAEWNGAVAKWRVEYQKALGEGKRPLPDKPKFEAGDDRFFSDVYLAKDAPLAVSEKDEAAFSAEQRGQISELQQKLEELKKSAPAEPEMACAVEDGEVVRQKVFIRGDYSNLGEDAPKAFPAILARYNTKPTFDKGSGRLQLAEWLTQPEHPLTARVMVNRIWGWHYGEGLVRTPDNFGKMGEPPTHPELLDYLAKRFVESGWSIKAMHRMLMLSSAYQMSSDNPQIAVGVDPDNRLLTRFNRRRLTIEEMRDSLLAIGGLIDLTMGGTLQQGRGTDSENSNDRLSLNPEKIARRTIYIPLRRANLPTLLNLFDFGDATTSSGKRQLTNVATQALFWLNSEFLLERSQAIAKSILGAAAEARAAAAASDAAQVEKAYIKILNRRPTKLESDQALQYIAGFKEKFANANPTHANLNVEHKAWQSFSRILIASNDFIYVD